MIAELQQETHVSYTYSGMGLKWEQLTAQTILVCDSVPRHSERLAVLFGDGHVEMRLPHDLELMLQIPRPWPSSHPVERQSAGRASTRHD
jgi:prepilin-type processing-associated H-X9-DG protein